MKAIQFKSFVLLFLFSCLSLSLSAQLELPRKSPKASTSYTVGLTNITIDYSAPAVNDRSIWGELVPYDEVWRAGANEATTMEFDTDINIEGATLTAGKYAFFLIPRAEGPWTAVFNKVADQWGAYKYDEAQDAARVDVKVKTAKSSEERLSYRIADQGMDKGYIRMGWENVRLYLRFRVKVMDQAMANIEEAIATGEEDKKWIIYAQAANFLLDMEQDADKALEYAKQSTSRHDHSWNWYTLAKAHAANNDAEGAVISARKAQEVGASNAEDNYYKSVKEEIAGAITKWTSGE